jgi:hypothetical protein
LAIAAVLSAAAGAATAEEFVLPEAAGLINVKSAYGAKGDGKTDDTAALQKAIDENKRRGRCLYLPNGTYLVSDKLTFGDNLEQAKHLTLQGQSQAGVILKLKDNCEGFGDAAKPKPLLTMFEGKNTGMAFQNSAYDMTLDVGKGNAGAIGLQWMSNNQGSLRSVTIRSSDPARAGAVGLDLTRTEPGPSLIQFVTIEGFDYGIKAVPGPFSTTFEHVTISGQRKAGISNKWHTMIFRDLRSTNKVPAIEATDAAYFLVMESLLAGGDGGVAAIDNKAGAMFLLRDVKQEGYARLLGGKGKTIDGNSVDEFISHDSKASSAFGDSPRKTLRLAVEATPQVPFDRPDKWIIPDPAALAEASGDCTIIQKAIDEGVAAGKTSLCLPLLPKGKIDLDGTITIPPQIRRVTALDGHPAVTDSFRPQEKPLLHVVGDTKEPLVIERMYAIDWGKDKSGKHVTQGYTFVQHDSPRPVVLRNYCGPAKGYAAGPKAGSLFLEDVCSARFTLRKGQKAWFRQWNPETNDLALLNPGAELWILGMKTETGAATIIKTTDGGRTELLGGQNYSSWTPLSPKLPMFVMEDAWGAFSIFQLSFDPKRGYETAMRESRGGEVKELSNKDAGGGPHSSYPLVTAGTPAGWREGKRTQP